MNNFKMNKWYVDIKSLGATDLCHPYEIPAIPKIYLYYLVVYRGGKVIIQSDKKKGQYFVKYTGLMISEHFEPLVPQSIPSPPSIIIVITSCTLFISGSAAELHKTSDYPWFIP